MLSALLHCQETRGRKERGFLELTYRTRFLNMVDLACVVFLVQLYTSLSVHTTQTSVADGARELEVTFCVLNQPRCFLEFP